MRRQDVWLVAAVAAAVIGAGASLQRVFTDGTWRPEALLALVLALAIAAGAHRLGMSVFSSVASSAVGLVVFSYITHLTAGPLIPGAAEFQAMTDLARDGIIQLQEQPAPTAPLDGLRLIVTTGVWVVTHVTHELLIRARRPLLALLPPAVLWLVPLAVPLPPSRTWPTAVPFLAAAGLILLLQSDRDVTGFTREDDRPPLSAGVTLGSVALIIAVIAPGLLPGYTAQPWVDLAGSDDPRGYQPIVDVGDRLKLPAPRDVLEVRADRPVYLRLAALETFDGTTWRLGPAGVSSYRPDPDQLFSATGRLPYETDIAVADRVVVDVEVLDLENIYVPVPYQVDRIDGPDGMFYSLTGGFVATGELADNEISGQLRVGVRPGVKYRVEAVIPSPSYDQLAALGDIGPPAEPAGIALPGPYDNMRDLANQVYADAGAATTIDKVLALQAWFVGDNSQFTYSTDTPALRGDLALQTFVFDTKTGYCEYFATAMAVMLRATGIPTRVAVGFLPGRQTDPPVDDELNDDPDAVRTFVVATTDAHAWVEVFFPGYGWVRMDPTPRSDGATMVPTADNLDPMYTERQRRLAELLDRVDDLPDERVPDGPDGPATEAPDDAPTAAPVDGGGTGDQEAGVRPWLVVTIVIMLLLSAFAVAVMRDRRTRAHASMPARDDVIAAQRALLHRARALGVGRTADETIADTLDRWLAEGRVESDALARFVPLAQAAAFGGPLPDNAGAEAWSAADEMTRQLGASVSRSDRMLAPVRVPTEQARRGASTAIRRIREVIRG